MSIKEELQIVVCGLGYVGLALAVEFGKKYHTIGFDINKERISELTRGLDKTLEQTPHVIQSAKQLSFTSDIKSFRCFQFLQLLLLPFLRPLMHIKNLI